MDCIKDGWFPSPRPLPLKLSFGRGFGGATLATSSFADARRVLLVKPEVKLLLTRHPPVSIETGICYGRSDVPLASGWETWARDLAKLCTKLGDQVVCYSSPASRCRIPAEALGLDVVEDPRLREMNFGQWEGRRWRDISPAEFRTWQTDIVNRAPPDGEPLIALDDRVKDFFGSMRGINGDAVIAITHGGPIRCLLADALGMPLPNLFRLRVDPGSLSTLTLEPDDAVVEFVNFKLLPANAPEIDSRDNPIA